MKISNYKINDKNAIEITSKVVNVTSPWHHADYYKGCDCSRVNANSTSVRILKSCETFKSPAEIFGVKNPMTTHLKGMAKAGLLNIYTIPELCKPVWKGVDRYLKTWYKITPKGKKVLNEIMARG